MIRKLRRKFILTNMALVSLVLAAAFGYLMLSTAASVQSSTESALRQALSTESPAQDTRPSITPRSARGSPSDAPPAKPGGEAPSQAAQPQPPGGDAPPEASTVAAAPETPQPDTANTPQDVPGADVAVFWVLLDDDGTITDSDTDAVNITDETLADVAAAWRETEQKSGILPKYDLRFLAQYTPEGRRVAFADRTAEWTALWGLARRLAVVGVCALAAFWGISALLAQMSLRPVARAWQQQRQFVADASHELKTPLTVIMANADLMANHPQTDAAKQRQWLDGIRDESARMRQLVEDMLFLARADALRKPDFAPVDLSTTVEGEALSFASVAYERGVELETDVAPGLTVQGDAKQLTQLTAILLDNACKYAGVGGQAGLQLRRRKNTAVLKVANTGAALTKDELDHLFERFYRTDAARTRGGYGLGLAIAQSIVKTHRGRITADSKDGKTTFTVTLPLEGTKP